MNILAIFPQHRKARNHRTPTQKKAAALVALKTRQFLRHDATIHEMALDLPGTAVEQGFVVQEYTCGILRDAWFFHDQHRVPLTDEEIEMVVEAGDRASPTSPRS